MSWYVKELKKLTRKMTDETQKELVSIYKKLSPQITLDSEAGARERRANVLKDKNSFPQKGQAVSLTRNTTDESISSQARIALNELNRRYNEKFSDEAKELVQKLLTKTNKYSNWQFTKSLKDMPGDKASGFSLAGSAISPEKSEIMKALLFDNVNYIKSIQSEYFTDITGAVARSIESGESLKEFISQFKIKAKHVERRAELIAQDQTRKAYNSINLRNFQDSGIKKFKWLHSGGSREPREWHKNVLDGQIFPLDEGAPNESGKKPEFIYPGQLPYCHCVMAAVLDFEDNGTIAKDEWKEQDHPRDKDGKFSSNSGGSSNGSNITSNEEKEQKIKSVKINPEKDNIFPELNKEEQEKLGVKNQKIRLKKSIYERNQKHNDVNKGEDEILIGTALYKPEDVIPGKKEGYSHLITRMGDNKNSLVLIDIDTNNNDGYLDIVHYYALNDKNRRRTIKNQNKKIAKMGGQLPVIE